MAAATRVSLAFSTDGVIGMYCQLKIRGQNSPGERKKKRGQMGLNEKYAACWLILLDLVLTEGPGKLHFCPNLNKRQLMQFLPNMQIMTN